MSDDMSYIAIRKSKILVAFLRLRTGGEGMKIKKVDDKKMIIHTKKKATIHMKKPIKAQLKARKTYTRRRSPVVKRSSFCVYSAPNISYKQKRKYKKNGIVSKYKNAKRDSRQSIKIKGTSIKIAKGMGAKKALSEMEGGEEVMSAATMMYVASKPVSSTQKKGYKLFRDKMKRKKIKQAKPGSHIAMKHDNSDILNEAMPETKSRKSRKARSQKSKKTRYHAGKNRTFRYGSRRFSKGEKSKSLRKRKIKSYLAKLRGGDNKLTLKGALKKIFLNKISGAAKTMMVAVGAMLLVLVLLVSIAILPVVGIVAILYSSPFAFFLPPLESGDTVTTVASSYISEFNREVNDLATNHTGYSDGRIVYVDYEGLDASNFNDIVTVYMVKYGVGDTATVMNDTSKSKLKDVFNDMCSYTTSSGTETVTDASGRSSSQTILYVNVTLKTCYDMIGEYNFNSDQCELVDEMMMMFASASGGSLQSALSNDQVTTITQGISDDDLSSVVSFLLSRVGYPYSQQYRDSGNYYDCSSLAYYSWKEAGVDISYGGSYTAAAEAEGLDSAGKTVSYDEIQPGDLIFYSYEYNGRYKNISHVAIYVGDGMVVEAKGTDYGVTYNAVPSVGSIVLVGRPTR